MKHLSQYFINGLIVIVPIAITIGVIGTILSFTEGVLGAHLPIHFPGIGFLAVVLLILLVGWLSSYWILRRMIAFGERILNKIPIVKFIYNSVKQLSTAVFESNNLLSQPVLVPYPHAEAKALGFIVSELSEPMKQALDEEHVCVFIPWSLNMTSGMNVIVPQRLVTYLDVSSESALQYVLTAGTVMPSSSSAPRQPNLYRQDEIVSSVCLTKMRDCPQTDKIG